ncbi:MAG: hypothetical protein BWY57_03051 [Betaproteobacteria bacterium ADurb.Bin341]|jgi:hypothetical protein|nr:MAG: hypothetical protein BWY57_03051 [Betaproteobacteria bacterium ADurb.Bin341]
MNLEALGDLMDGKGELAGAIACNEQRIAQIVQQMKFLHTVVAEVHDLADEKSVAPLNNIGLIRIKAQVALRVAAQSGLLS